MNFYTQDGIYKLDFQLSKLERDLFDQMSRILEAKGFKYLSVPSSVRWDTLLAQGFLNRADSFGYDEQHALAGSAEQGILEYFRNRLVDPQYIYAINSCFRLEPKGYNGLRVCKEFKKLEQFAFCKEGTWDAAFDLLLKNATEFLQLHDIEFRVVDVTDEPGYHKRKFDIEVMTKDGWMETHSCTYFGEEQTERFGITGATHTVSNTGMASPRILIPFIERAGDELKRAGLEWLNSLP